MINLRPHPAILWAILTILACAWMLHSCEPARAEVSEVVLQTIAMESADQPFEGQVAVAQVILNRARRANISPESVVLRPKQFSCWNSPKWARRWLGAHYTPKARRGALNAYRKAMLVDMTNTSSGLTKNYNGVTMYHTVDCKPKWDFSKLERLGQIGAHIFYRERNYRDWFNKG